MKYIIFIISSLLFLGSCQQKQKEDPKTYTLIVEKLPVYKFGINTENYTLTESLVKQNQTIGDIFSDNNIAYAYILKASEMDSIFDIRKINTGQSITYFYSKDSLPKLDYLVYEKDLRSYVIFNFTDSFQMYLGEKEIEHRLRQVSGLIQSSLWNAMTEIQVNPLLAIELSEVYAWSIDFFGLQKDDHFSVVYEESYIDSNFYEIEKIHAIRFDHAGQYFYAYRFMQDEVWQFFDENGNSLRKAFLKAPLRFSRISSRFSNSRYHPVLKIRRPHHGVDYAAPKGTEVYTVGDGKVIKKGWDAGGGRYVKIKHNSVYTTVYMHFSKFANINEGDFVQQGQVIGYVGSSGLATGPHLDFRFYKNGQAVDPLKVESPSVDPVKAENKVEYLKIIDQYQSILDSLINVVHLDSIP